MKVFEKIMDEQLVKNLGAEDLMVHARHIYLSAAKDFLNNGWGSELICEDCLNIALKIQEAIECWGNR